MPPALELRGVRKKFRTFTLGPLDLTVPEGAIYGFVGPNGAGKTTTIDLIFGMGATAGGTITALGLDHRRDSVAMKSQVGYVGPDLNFRSWGRVRRAIAFVRGFYPTWDSQYCAHLLTAFDLSPDANIGTLSFGGRMRLAIVLALAWRPRLLVLDEPTAGLDAIGKQQLFAELLAAVREDDRTVFISSHAITDLQRFADHIGMIKNGQMLIEGPVDAVLERYRMVDLSPMNLASLGEQAGITVQGRDEHRVRALVDVERAPLSGLAQRGAIPLGEAPVSLEELFVALGR